MMRRFLAIALVSLALAGCAGGIQKALNVVNAVTVGIDNPVTPERLHYAENVLTGVFIALNTYKQSCIRGLIPRSCRQVIQQMQIYTRKMPPALNAVRRFVDRGDKVNAIQSYNLLMEIVAAFKTVAAANNVPVGAI